MSYIISFLQENVVKDRDCMRSRKTINMFWWCAVVQLQYWVRGDERLGGREFTEAKNLDLRHF